MSPRATRIFPKIRREIFKDFGAAATLATVAVFFAAKAAAQAPCVCLRCLSFQYLQFQAASGSMKPLLPPGACLVVDRHFGPEDLSPGTVITFTHPVNGTVFVKRILAGPGQTFQMQGGVPVIDGRAVEHVAMPDHEELFERQGEGEAFPICGNGPVEIGGLCRKGQATETVGGVSYAVLNAREDFFGDDTELFTVPDGHLFVLGDNRDNSVDSRVIRSVGGIGFVPVDNVIGILDEVRP